MAETAPRSRAVRAAVAGVLLRLRASRPRLQRQQQYARLALAEIDLRRLDSRTDAMLDILARVCDNSGQPEAAREVRALSGQEAALREPALRLVRGQH